MNRTILNKNIAVFIVLLILIAIIVFQNVSANGKAANIKANEANEANNLNAQRTGPKPGFQAPGITLTGMDGNELTIGGVRDKPMMINFWASWCDPCEAEAPDLKILYEKYAEAIDLYAVNTTDKDNLADAKKFVKLYKLPFPILLDSEGKAADLFRVNFVPTSFLVDRNGTVVEVIHVLTADELERKIIKLIEG